MLSCTLGKAGVGRDQAKVEVSVVGDYYAELGIFRRLMERLRVIAADGQCYRPVLATPLTG